MISLRTTMRCMVLSCTIFCLQHSQTVAFSTNLAARIAASHGHHSSPWKEDRSCALHMNLSDEDARLTKPLQNRTRRTGRKRAILRKYSKAIALSTTLIYGPMASAPLARRFIGGSTAHAAASTMAHKKSDYNFQDFKDVKKKLSLAPGANVQKYEEILERVEVEGDAALENMKPGDLESALTVGGSDEKGSAAASGRAGRAKKKAQKKQSKKQEVSEWESDEFGFTGEEEDELEGVMNMGRSSSKPAKGKKKLAGGSDSGKGDVVITDKMAYNNYQEALGKDDHMKTIKKLSFYSIFPVFVITMVRGQIRAFREKKKVKLGLELFEQEKREYEEEMKNKGKGDEEDDDDDDDDDDY